MRTLSALRHDPLSYLERHAVGDGGPARLRVGKQPVLLVTDPEPVYELLVTRNRDFVKTNVIDAAGAVASRGRTEGLVLTDDADVHARARRAVHPLFTAERLSARSQAIADRFGELSRSWRDGDRVAVGTEFAAAAISVLVAEILGGDVSGREGEIREDVRRVLAPYRFATSPARTIAAAFGPDGRASVPALQRLRELAEEIGGASGEDGLAVRLSREFGNDTALGELPERIRNDIVGLLIAGVETTANALVWACILLARHPDWQRRIREETVGPRPAADVLPSARAVFGETLRLYPPSWFVGRRARGESAVGGLTVAEGDVVLASPYLSHRNEGRFPSASRFLPERWLDRPPPQRASYLPFGLGPRRCLGEQLAWLEGTLALAAILRRWRLTSVSPAEVHPEAAASLRPRELVEVTIERLPRGVDT